MQHSLPSAAGWRLLGPNKDIVADSVPEKEYEESLNKAQAVLRAIERVRD